ncbi:MAG: hypothetical protein ACMXYG_02640 [Candidatus Woesearchaeota archaeon]
MSKRSQLTLFMMSAIIILVVFAIFFFASAGTVSLTFLRQPQHPVKFYVEECMKFNLIDATEILTSQGGFIYEFEPNLTTTKRMFAYSIKDNINTSPSIPFMEREIALFIENNIDECIENSSYYITTSGSPSAIVTIFPESIFAELHYEIITPVGDVNMSFLEFGIRHAIPLGRMIELRDVIIKDLLDYPNLMLLDKLYDTDFEMIINPYTGRIKVIDMINTSARLRNNPLTFSFAMHDLHSFPDKLDFTFFPDDIVATVGVPMTLYVGCSRDCNFYDNTILFNINHQNGIIRYIPDALDVGIYNITITARDKTYTISKSFQLTVTA